MYNIRTSIYILCTYYILTTNSILFKSIYRKYKNKNKCNWAL